MKIRLAMATVQFLCKINTTTFRFGGIGSERHTFELDEKLILNLEDIDFTQKFIKIITPEKVSFGLFHSITFTREIELPK